MLNVALQASLPD